MGGEKHGREIPAGKECGRCKERRGRRGISLGMLKTNAGK